MGRDLTEGDLGYAGGAMVGVTVEPRRSDGVGFEL